MIISKYKHISFDLDGTLVHTASEYRYRVVFKTLNDLGSGVKSKSLIDKFWFGANRDKTIKNEFGILPQKFWKEFRKIDIPEKRSEYTEAYNDVESTLKKIKRMNKLISIITGSLPGIAKMEIKKLNDAPYDYYLSIGEEKDSGFLSKPSPGSFNYVMDKLKVMPKDTLYIGNNNEDELFAKNAGVDFIRLDRKEYESNFGNYSLATIHSLKELL